MTSFSASFDISQHTSNTKINHETRNVADNNSSEHIAVMKVLTDAGVCFKRNSHVFKQTVIVEGTCCIPTS